MMRVFCVVSPCADTITPSVRAPSAPSAAVSRCRAVTPDDAHAAARPPSAARCSPRCRRRRAQVFARHLHDRHGRLRGDALHASPHELVEHQVADDEDAYAAKRRTSSASPPPRYLHASSS